MQASQVTVRYRCVHRVSNCHAEAVQGWDNDLSLGCPYEIMEIFPILVRFSGDLRELESLRRPVEFKVSA